MPDRSFNMLGQPAHWVRGDKICTNATPSNRVLTLRVGVQKPRPHFNKPNIGETFWLLDFWVAQVMVGKSQILPANRPYINRRRIDIH